MVVFSYSNRVSRIRANPDPNTGTTPPWREPAFPNTPERVWAYFIGNVAVVLSEHGLSGQWVSAHDRPSRTSATRGGILQVAGLEAGVLHDLLQQVRRGQSQALGGAVPLAGGGPCSAGLA